MRSAYPAMAAKLKNPHLMIYKENLFNFNQIKFGISQTHIAYTVRIGPILLDI